MSTVHRYEVQIDWTGNVGQGTSSPTAYRRDHEISAEGKATIAASSDPAFRGDLSRWNPEELFVASLSQCHMLWYLGLCAKAGIVVTGYIDRPTGDMVEDRDGRGRFTSVTLRPAITLSDPNDQSRADALHHEAHAMCFIANSVTCPVNVEARYIP